MVSPVTDPELLRLLEEGESTPVQVGAEGGPQPVTDPDLLRQLNEGEAQRQQSQPEERSALDEFGRQIGLTGRALAGGAAQLVEPFTEPVRYLMNQALPGNPVGNIEAATDEALSLAGVPEPQGDLEEGVQGVGRFMTSLGSGAGAASMADDAIMTGLGLMKNPRMEALTTEQLRELANASYKAADDAGLMIRPDSFQGFVNRISRIAQDEGADRTIHPKVTAAIKRFQEAVDEGDPLKLADIETLRRVIGAARGSIEKDERRIAGIIQGQLDDYLYQLGARDTLAGNPQAAGEALKRARNLWSRMSKSETIQSAIEKAGIRAGQFSGSGFENALRTQFRQIAMNPKRMRGFTPDEQAAIKKVAMGGPLDNAMRMLGKLAPTGVISGGVSSGAGYAIGGVPGAIALPAIGAGARRAATAMTARNANNVDEMVRLGSKPEQALPDWLPAWLVGGTYSVNSQGN